jgi:hypothetical protein
MKDLDGRDIPGAMIATTEFEEAADTQAKAIGFMPGIVYVPHPIQNRTEAELREIAEQAIAPILAMITADGAED